VASQERSITENIFHALNVSGQLMRSGITQLAEGKLDESDYLSDIFSGKDVFPASRLRKAVVGEVPQEDRNMVTQAGEFIMDFGLDVATSPNIIGAFGRGAKALGAGAKLTKAVTGATLGALAGDETDTVLDRAAKVAAGATVGAALPSLGVGAKWLGKEAEKHLDSIIGSVNRTTYSAFQAAGGSSDLTYSKAVNRLKVAQNTKYIPYARYHDESSRAVDNAIIKPLIDSGATELQIKAKLEEFDRARELMGKDQITMRNLIRERLTEASPNTNSRDIWDEATRLSNDFSMENIAKHADDPLVQDALVAHSKMNDELGEIFNKQMVARGDAHLQFVPLKFHSADLHQITDLPTEGIKIGKPGAKPRFSSDFKLMVGEVDREEIRALGSDRYAKLFLDQSEKEAASLVAALAESKGKSSIRSGVSKLLSATNEAETGAGAAELARGTLKAYDGFLGIIKSAQLVGGSSWMVNNMSDNVAKAYLADGPEAALNTAVGQMVGFAQLAPRAGIELVDYFRGKKLSRIRHNAKELKELSSINMPSRIYAGLDPTNSGKIARYTDDALKLAADSGVIESGLYKSSADLVRENRMLAEITMGEKGVQNIVDNETMTDQFIHAVNTPFKGLWATVGRLGSTMENTSRITVFESIMEAKAKTDPRIANILKRYKGKTHDIYSKAKLSPDTIIEKASTPGRVRAEFEYFKEAVDDAANKVNNIFIDYNDTTVFEDEVMKRIIPYWTFFSRNFGIYANALFDPERVGKIANLSKVSENMGESLDDRTRLGTPDYMLEGMVKKSTKKGPRGETVLIGNPSSSLVDAMNMLGTGVVGKMQEKISPLLKTPFELLNNKNIVTGQGIAPDVQTPLQKIPESYIGLLPDAALNIAGIARDEKGDMLTNSPAAGRLAYIARNLLPVPFLDQIARGIRNMERRGFTPTESLVEEVGPQQQFILDRQNFNRLSGERKRNLVKLQDLDMAIRKRNKRLK
jgi:hypothetical protein